MKIFITGASGKIGKNLSNFLINKNYFCILNSRKKIKIKVKKKGFYNYRKDILEKNFTIPECEVVIHTASNTPDNNNKIAQNQLIDKKIFSHVKKNSKIKKMIFISTVAIYNQNNKSKKVNENSKLLSKLKYPTLKLKSENLFLKNKKIKVYNIRVPGLLLTGKENNFISNLVEKIKNLKKFNIYNSSQLFNNLLLINSLNLFIENLIKKNFNSGNILLGSSNPLRLNKIVDIISNYFNVNSFVSWKSSKNKGFYLDIALAIKKYNFKPLSTQKSILNYLNKSYPKNV